MLRIAFLAYQEGFGGHFHNDNALASLRDIPGLIVACPARPDDAAAMLRTCLAAAEADGRVCVFLEPIALYHTRDLHEAGDGGWLAGYDPRGGGRPGTSRSGGARSYGNGRDLTIITFGNGLRMSLRVAARLAADGIGCRVLDLRWIAPLPGRTSCARPGHRAGLVADETRRTGGVSEAVITSLVDAGFTGKITRVNSEDSFIPLGDAAQAVLLSRRPSNPGHGPVAPIIPAGPVYAAPVGIPGIPRGLLVIRPGPRRSWASGRNLPTCPGWPGGYLSVAVTAARGHDAPSGAPWPSTSARRRRGGRC